MTNILTLAEQGPPGPIAASVLAPANLSALVTSTLPAGSFAYAQSVDAYFRYLPSSTATADGVNAVTASGGGRWVKWVGIPSSSQTLAYGGVTAYAVKPTDALVVFDSSLWVSPATALVATLSATPYVGERHAFYYDGWVGGAPAPQVNGNGKPMIPYSPGSRTSKGRAASNVISITDFAGIYQVVWSGSAWLPG